MGSTDWIKSGAGTSELPLAACIMHGGMINKIDGCHLRAAF